MTRPTGPARENPYAPPAAPPRRPKAINRVAYYAFFLALAPPAIAALAPLAWFVSPRIESVVYALRWLMFLGSPAAVFAVALGIIAMQGRQSGYALAALLVGGAECLLIVVGLLVTI